MLLLLPLVYSKYWKSLTFITLRNTKLRRKIDFVTTKPPAPNLMLPIKISFMFG